MNRFKVTQEYPDVQVISQTGSSEIFSVIGRINERFKLVLVEDGTGVLNIGECQETFIAPAIFCFDELEKPKLIRSINLSVRLLYFHPRVINSSYSFELLRNIDGITDFTIRSNRQLLRPFFDKSPEYIGLLNMNGVNGKSVAYLLNAIQGEITNQNYTYIRTVLFELLILIQKIYYEYFGKEKINQTSTMEQSATNLFDGMGSQIHDSDDDIKEIINYLNANFRRKITLDELSKLFYLNRMTLNQRFAKATGMSVKHYLTKLRIRTASFLLQNPEFCISDIPEHLGFYDSAHFYRIFRKYTGCSPSDYQRRYCV
jgi:AraC-like DNA-binding protein